MKHRPSKVWEHYKVGGNKLERTGRVCPRCGEGVFLAVHKEKNGSIRYFCGKCHFSEWVRPKA